MKHFYRLGFFSALLLAFALRVAFLDAPSLWNDEGTSVALASRSIEAIVSGAARDIHPPLYYLLLHFWMPFVGNTEYAVRFLSVIAGVLVVALVFRIAYSVFDGRVAMVAAFLTALSPFQVYYSQETRMYIWVTLWSAVSFWAFVRLQVTGYRFQIE
ncbi:MAG: glycosyltransferase family 39 protein, partial [Anaerolineae bacterium]|nr:glycosyltransferase family 39 protein [Anaerolineae bacterium]